MAVWSFVLKGSLRPLWQWWGMTQIFPGGCWSWRSLWRTKKLEVRCALHVAQLDTTVGVLLLLLMFFPFPFSLNWFVCHPILTLHIFSLPPTFWQMAEPWSTVCRWTSSTSWSRHVCVQMKNPCRTCTTACVSFCDLVSVLQKHIRTRPALNPLALVSVWCELLQ